MWGVKKRDDVLKTVLTLIAWNTSSSLKRFWVEVNIHFFKSQQCLKGKQISASTHVFKCWQSGWGVCKHFRSDHCGSWAIHWVLHHGRLWLNSPISLYVHQKEAGCTWVHSLSCSCTAMSFERKLYEYPFEFRSCIWVNRVIMNIQIFYNIIVDRDPDLWVFKRWL